MPRFAHWKHALAITLAVLTSACAESRVMTLPPAPEALFDNAIPVAVSGTSTITNRHGHVIAGAGDGAAKGAVAGAGRSVLAGAGTMNPYGLAAGIVLAPVFLVGGGIAVGIAAHLATETRAALAAIEAVYADQALLRTCRPRLVGASMLRAWRPDRPAPMRLRPRNHVSAQMRTA